MCEFIPVNVLKEIGDKDSLKISKRLRSERSGLRRSLSKVLSFRKTANREIKEERLTYDCQNTTNLPGLLVAKNKSMPTTDPVAIDAHIGADKVFSFLYNRFDRNSLDDKGMAIISSVHYGINYNNAYYDGQQIIFGDGDGEYFIPLAKALDVMAHELGHGIIDNTAKLVYWFQPGAANESFADMFGIAIEHYYNKEKNPKTANWLIGESIIGPKFPGKAIRSFKNEKAFSGDDQPKHMKNYVWTVSDNGGVHINSGILNHAFYLLCLKLNEPSYGKPIQIMYQTLLKLGKFSGFKKIAETAVNESARLFGQDSLEKQAVLESFKEVGILK